MRLDPQLLAGLPFLATLPPEDREGLALCFQGRGYAPNEVIFSEGDPGSSMLIVAQGTLIATSRSSGSREVGRFGPGQTIGEAALLDHAPRPVTLYAATAALVFELPEESFDALRKKIPAAARALAITSLRSLLRRLRGVEEKVEAELTRTSVVW
jgi:CRP/FNR family transcriptional regulator, cyclic AMP receptor protein